MIARLVRLLPEPDSPTSANVSPGLTKKETSCTVGISVPPRRKPTLMFSTRSVGAVVDADAMSVVVSRGSRASRSPSPMKLKLVTANVIAKPGKIASHGAEARYCWALLSMLPQLGVGG